MLGEIRPGGPRFLVLFGCGVQLLLGAIFIVTGGALSVFGGGSGLTFVACVQWACALATLYFVREKSAQSQRVAAAAAAVSLLARLLLGTSWLFWWLFSGGLVALGAAISARGGYRA